MKPLMAAKPAGRPETPTPQNVGQDEVAPVGPASIPPVQTQQAPPLQTRPNAMKPRGRPADEDLLADLPPAQVPLRIRIDAVPVAAPPAPMPAVALREPLPPAAQRAFRVGRAGARPRHAMSAVEISAWLQGAMEAGRSRDPIFGRPRLWWWLLFSAVMVGPMAYAAAWLGLASNGSEFLSTRLGQEAWMLFGGPEGASVYWVMLMAIAMVSLMFRPLEPVLIVLAGTWWVWTGLHAAWLAGWLAQRIPPLPLPG